jgi:hypothetical protein
MESTGQKATNTNIQAPEKLQTSNTIEAAERRIFRV